MKFITRLLKFNSSRHRLWEVNADFASNIPSGARILDAGSGSAPYKNLFSHTQYETADFEQLNKTYAKSTYICNLESIPVNSNRFDYIIFNQVMEHLPDPKLVLSELHRVLKPGGKMIYSGPFFYEEHEQPYDYFRYTQFGLKELFNSTGFVIEHLDWLEGYFGTVGYQLNRMCQYLPTNYKQLGGGIVGMILVPFMIILKIIFGVLSILFHKLEIRTKFKLKGYPKNYFAVVNKT